jgi:ABC-2 type transport system permease protein
MLYYALVFLAIAIVAGVLGFGGVAAGAAGFVTFAGFILNGYQGAVPQLAPFANLTWWGWTSNHIALAGQYDWPSVELVAVVAVVLLTIGIEAFARRDIGVTTAIPWPSMPRALLGLGGPIGRAISNSLGAAVAWGVGVGFFGFVLGSAAQGFMEQLGDSPQFVEMLSTIFPNVDYASAGGFLQLLFVEFGVILTGLAASSFVGGWASDETSGRLEMTLATPLSRARWALSGGIGMLANVAIFIALAAAGIGLGVGTTESDVMTPLVGSLVLGLYAAALVGIGLAVGGILGTRFASTAVVVFVIATWFVQLLGPLLNLPDVVRELGLTSHYGQPMVGVWDGVGIAASLAIAIAGMVIGTWAFTRRDLRF